MNARDLVNKMAAAEDDFLRRSFIAPVVKGGGVRVRLSGIVWEFAVVPPDHQGWAVLQPLDRARAQVVREATLAQVREYLSLFPLLPLILCGRRDDRWWGLPADSSGHVRVSQPVPVLLTGEVQLFENVRARWDGARFLYEGRNSRRDPSVAVYLRESLAEPRKPEDLSKRTLTPEERAAYGVQYALLEQEIRDTTEERLRDAVAHADGTFRSFLERKDGYRVTFDVEGVTHTAAIRKDDLTVMLAGICLSGEDEKFDLTSLVGVLRESHGGYVPRVGQEGGLPEDVYRQIHPRGRRRRNR